MTKQKVRHLTARPGRNGAIRYYWQPTSRLRAAGLALKRLSDDAAVARQEAGELNAAADRIVGRAPGSTADGLQITGGSLPETTARWTYLYVIGTLSGSQKIGISKRPAERIRAMEHASGKSLRVWMVFGSEFISALAVERMAHAMLAQHRRKGEWFECVPGVAVNAVLTALARRWGSQQSETDLLCSERAGSLDV